MKKYILALVIGIISFTGFQALALTLPATTGTFETSLQSRITPSDTSLTLVATSTAGGGHLAPGYQCFTLDEGLSTNEWACGQLSATTNVVSSLERGLSPLTGTSTIPALQMQHRVGADVKITDFPQIQRMKALLNGEDLIPNVMRYASAPSWVYGLNELVTWEKAKDYADSVGLAGAPNADKITKGVLQVADPLQAASSTASGSTGAFLALTSSIATSTCQVATSSVLTLQSNGKVYQGCLDLSQLFAFTGGVGSTGTTTISASSVTANPLVLNGIPHRAPITQGASSTALLTDGQGKLTWGSNQQVSTLYVAGDYLGAASSATTTVKVVTIPANTLNTGKFLRIFATYNLTVPVSSGCFYEIGFGNGTATTSVFALNNNFEEMNLNIIATSTTNELMAMSGTGNSGTFHQEQFAGVNLASLSFLSFGVRSVSNSTCSLVGATVEMLQ